MAKCYFITLIVALFLFKLNAQDLKNCKFDQIYQLGDSFADTGNDVIEDPKTVFAKPPYGKSFFKRLSTGRPSDGQLIIDYLAVAASLPFVPPFKNLAADTRHGDNFAIAGATALNAQMLASKGLKPQYTDTSLDKQLDFMFSHFNSICEIDCIKILKRALFFVGEIGFSDYTIALDQGKSFQETISMVPDVVTEIKKAIERVIEYGAIKIVVPGLFPLGCFPIHLTKFITNVMYDGFGCLKPLNDISYRHNQQLQAAIGEVQKKNKNIMIVYADYFNTFYSLLNNAKKPGSDIKNTQQACCGAGGKYNFDFKRKCGFKGASVCPQPAQYIHWDGIHLTQRAYKEISQYLVADIATKLKCNA